MARASRGERGPSRRLLAEFAEFLDHFFARKFTDEEAMVLVPDTLRTVHCKLGTCDPDRAILPWLLAIADHRASCVEGSRQVP